MSQQQKADPIGRPEVDQLQDTNLSKLTERAHRAYERRETKECLDLTRAMLLIDPQNAAALKMRSSIQSDLQRDLQSTRALFRQPPLPEPAAPESQPETFSSLSAPEFDRESVETGRSDFGRSYMAASKRSQGPRWLVAAAIAVLVVLIVVAFPKLRTLNASTGSATSIEDSMQQAAAAAPLASSQRDVAAILMSPAAPVAVAAPPVAHPATKLPDPPPPAPVEAGEGTLAVSSPTSVDIYRNDVFLGSVPISLNLPAGNQTLEYRHGNLRKTVTYVVNSNETTKAMITFDVTVQINSKPWADVYIDGAQRRPLGQTPLGSVRVPIGTVLAFENPKFQTKKYRVTGNETGIQNVFP
jgi:hypothetical protein